MLTGFKTVKQHQKAAELDSAAQSAFRGMLELLQDAITEALQYNSFKVHIEGEPFRAEFKLPDNMELATLNSLVKERKLQPYENKILGGGEILLHSFKVLPLLNQVIEVLYRPIPRPRF